MELCGAAPGCRLVDRGERFTRRERDVVRALAAGRTRREAGFDLGIRPGTVQHHCRSAFAKYDAATLVELLATIGWLAVP